MSSLRSTAILGISSGLNAPIGPSLLNIAPPKSRALPMRPSPSTNNANSRPQGPEMAAFIEHNKKDSKGNQITKRYQKGILLGKGGFARCYKVMQILD